tara:strand:- start:40630 stop:41490 length:861 start_codon:yes stop_codon:yes gene_type:complete
LKYLSFIRPDGIATIGKLDDASPELSRDSTVIELLTESNTTIDLKTALATRKLSSLIAGPSYRVRDIRLLPVIPEPGKIICVGLNYASHVAETGRRKDAQYPVIFTRFPDTLVAHGEAIIRPAQSTSLDYEGELALIIGKPGRAISEQDAYSHIAGYSCFNDASVRDWQLHASQYTPGKNFPATGGFGPCLVTPDEITNLENQRVTTKLNDTIVQDQPISDLIFPIPVLINYISSFTALQAGDVIVTGTPGGVGFTRKPPLWMVPGDTVEVSVGEVGTLINPVRSE